MSEKPNTDSGRPEPSRDDANQQPAGDGETIKCPVCPAARIPAEADTCPSCGTDLRPLQRARELPRLHYNQALELARLGAWDSAMLRLSAALALDETFWEARRFLGKLLWETGAEAEAIRQWRLAARLAPQDQELTESLQTAVQTRKARSRAALWRRARMLLAWFLSVAAAVTFTAVMLNTGDTATEGEQPAGAAKSYATEWASVRDDMKAARDEVHRLGASLDARSAEREADAADAVKRAEQGATNLEAMATAVAAASRGLAEMRTAVEGRAEDVQVLLAGFQAVEEQLKLQRRELSEARAAASVLGADLAGLSRQVAAEAQEVDRIRQQLADGDRNTARSFQALARLLRPREADDKEDEIARLRADVERLRSLEHQARERGWLVIDSVRLFDLGSRRRLAARQLRDAEEQYEKLMASWREAAAVLRLPAAGSGARVPETAKDAQ